MESREELLKEMALRYIISASKLGFTSEEIVHAVSTFTLNRNILCENIKSEMELYCALFEKTLRKYTRCEDFPKEDVLKKGLIIMYVIHQKKYAGVKSFIELVVQELGAKSAGMIIGSNPYAGLVYIIRQEMMYSEWTMVRRTTRLEILEEIEGKWYLIFKDEFENKAGLV